MSAPLRPPADAAHPPLSGQDEGCLEVVSERLQHSPGIVSVEANFDESTLTVRYLPRLVEPDHLNAVADEVGALFAQRVTHCERREALGGCDECALRLGHLSASADRAFEVTVTPGRIAVARREPAEGSIEMVRPLSGGKPWNARMSAADQTRRSMRNSCCSATTPATPFPAECAWGFRRPMT
jgi:hypothetical protein